jgi:DNA-binding NarL/FixJ family response regulator
MGINDLQHMWENLRGRSETRTFTVDRRLAEYVYEVARREKRPANQVAAALLESGLRQRAREDKYWRIWDHLSPREQQVVALVCQGFTNRQIAAKLVVSVNTVRTHVRHVLYKFNAKSKRELQRELHHWDFSAW